MRVCSQFADLIKFEAMIEYITNNWGELLLAFMLFAKAAINLMPDTAVKPRMVFGWVDVLVNSIVADRKK